MIAVRIVAAFALLGSILAVPAQAQWGGVNAYVTGLNSFVPVNPANTSIMAFSPGFCSPPGGPSLPAPGTSFCTNTGFIPLTAFSSAQDARFNALNAEVSKALEIGAVAAAMKDAIPNTGDRFAIRLNAAGFEGYAAGAVGVSWNFTDRARLSLNYGQSRSQSVVS